MCLRCLLILCALQLTFVRGDGGQQPVWWVENPLIKVKPLDPVPGAPQKNVALYAGLNEFEPFQLVLRGGAMDLPGIDIEFSDLRSSDGAIIPKNNVTVYFEQFLNLTRPSSSEGGAGWWPDPLIPRIDQYEHQRRNAFPFTLRSGRNQPLWIEVFVPLTAHRGKYSGEARVSVSGIVRFSVPVKLTVWAFALPSTSTLKSSFGLNGTTVLKKHRGQYTSDEDLYALTRLYTKAALLHRLSIHSGSGVPPKHSYKAGQMQIDWGPYDAEIRPFLDGTVITPGEPLQGAKATSVDLRSPAIFETDDQQMAWWRAWSAHFEEAGWRDRLFLYLWDEPAATDYPKVLQRGRTAVRADAAIRNLVTVPFTKKLNEVVRIWVPLVNCLIVKPGFDDFCELTPPLDAYSGETVEGRNLWFYQSCASHGCNIVGGQYFAGWPSYVIDTSGPANRVMQWIAWKFRIGGELYYSMNEAYSHNDDPWTNVLLFGGNGDGTLFYPGRPDHIGGHADIPIESIRLKLIREGMEDYEYLALLAKLGGRKAAERFADRIVQQPYSWEARPLPFLAVRQEIGEALDRLAAEGRTDAQ